MSLRTETQVIKEGYEAFINGGTNDYIPNTWAYRAWEVGYKEAMRSGEKRTLKQEQKASQEPPPA